VPSLAIAKQQYNELAYSNNFAHFFKKYPNLWKKFMNENFSQTVKGDFTVVDSSKVKEKLKDVEIEDDESGEKRQLVKRELKNIDLLVIDGKSVIVIENKIRSGINGYKINDGVMTTQLDKYYEYVKETYPKKDVWLWTGYLYEDIIELLPDSGIDVIIDGQFKEELKDLRLKHRGSSNQRVIDVQASIKGNNIILFNN
jgi:hypothetical protein